MRSVGIKVLKNRLSEYVRAVAAGETVLVTDRNRVVAELGPPRRRPGRSVEDILAKGAREGWYTPPEASVLEPMDDFGPEDDPPIPFDVLMEDLRRDRDDR